MRSKLNGDYIRTEVKYTEKKSGMLRAVSTEVADWEKFNLVWISSRGGWALRSNYTGLYVSAETRTGDELGILRARAQTASDWELFAVYRFSDGTYSFRSFKDGKFVAVETTYTGDRNCMLRARSGTIGNSERFYLS